jgi:hypothetical protein
VWEAVGVWSIRGLEGKDTNWLSVVVCLYPQRIWHDDLCVVMASLTMERSRTRLWLRLQGVVWVLHCLLVVLCSFSLSRHLYITYIGVYF